MAVLVSDRHDNIGMDEVVRKVADAAGATVVLDAGDDTSTGETWEEFSLDSLDKAFQGYDDRVFVAGNHDNGTFVDALPRVEEVDPPRLRRRSSRSATCG